MRLGEIVVAAKTEPRGQIVIDVTEEFADVAGGDPIKLTFGEPDIPTIAVIGREARAIRKRYVDIPLEACYGIATLALTSQDDMSPLTPGDAFAAIAQKRPRLYLRLLGEIGTAWPYLANPDAAIEAEGND